MRVLLWSCTVFTIASASRLILSRSEEDLIQLEKLEYHFQAVHLESNPDSGLPDKQELISQDHFDAQLDELLHGRGNDHNPLDPLSLEPLRNLVLISEARVKKNHFYQAIIEMDIQILNFLLGLAKPKVIQLAAASEEFNYFMNSIPVENSYLPKIIIHLLDCQVKVESKRLLSIFVQTPELAAQLAQHKHDFNFEQALDLCTTKFCCWYCFKLLHPDAFDAFIPYCCPSQSLSWAVKAYAKLEPNQAARMTVSLLPRYLELSNIRILGHGIVRECLEKSRIDLAIYMIIRGAPLYEPDATYGTSQVSGQPKFAHGLEYKSYMKFQEIVFPKIKLLASADCRDEGYGMFAMFPRDIVHLILVLMFEDFVDSILSFRSTRDSFIYFDELMSATTKIWS